MKGQIEAEVVITEDIQMARAMPVALCGRVFGVVTPDLLIYMLAASYRVRARREGVVFGKFPNGAWDIHGRR